MRDRIIGIISLALALWIGGTGLAFQLSHPELTQTQVFLHTPKTLVLDFSIGDTK